MSKRRAGGKEFEAGAQPRGELIRPSALFLHRIFDGGREPLHPILIGGRETGLLALKVLIEGRAREPGQFDDVSDLRVLVAVVGEGGGEAVEDPAALVGDHLGAREPGTRPNPLDIRRRSIGPAPRCTRRASSAADLVLGTHTSSVLNRRRAEIQTRQFAFVKIRTW